MLLASILVSIKFNEDDYYENSFYAKVGGIKLQEINNLESTFLNDLEFEIFIKPEIFENYKSHIMNELLSESENEQS